MKIAPAALVTTGLHRRGGHGIQLQVSVEQPRGIADGKVAAQPDRDVHSVGERLAAAEHALIHGRPPSPGGICETGVMRQFPVVMRGYSRRDVDELFARIDAAPGLAPITPAQIRATTFRTQMRGYAPGEVDAALRAVLKKLEDEN